jgi:O-antigen/teichoic acid export membrane protein
MSAPPETRENRWNLFFHISIIVAVALSFILFFSETITSFFVRGQFNQSLRILLILFPLIEGMKVIVVTKLSSILDFKGISIALIIKQILLYGGIISFAFFYPALGVLLLLVFFSEGLELLMLIRHANWKGINILPYRQSKRFGIDKTARKFMFYSGLEQIFLTFALQFPTIFVVIVIGKLLAPEFQLPFAAVTIPVSLVMNSIAKVSFPHYSNLRENEKIRNSLFSLLFPVTFILFPVLLGIHFFAREIIHIFFDKSWQLAIFSLQTFPLLMMVYVLGVPSTFVSNIKQKPYINLIYAIVLLISRIITIFLGYKLAGFHGTIVFFVAGDIIVRMLRLKVDMTLLMIPLKRLFHYIRYNLLCMFMMLILMWLGYLMGLPKIISFLAALLIAMSLNYYWEQKKVKDLTIKLLNAVLPGRFSFSNLSGS